MFVAEKRRILVVDDQLAIHDDYRKIIGLNRRCDELSNVEAQLFGGNAQAAEHWNDYEVDCASNGQEGIQLVRQSLEKGRPYAVAFVDIRMPPGIDGVATIKCMWAVDPDILIVLCSAYSDYSWDDISYALGRSDRFLILRKPFDNIEVRQCAAALSERWLLARVDALTSLLNRRAFQQYLDQAWRRSVNEGMPLACVMVDIDFFKKINDNLGHRAGDAVIIQVADLIRQACRDTDHVCRYGGEEFCVLLPGYDEQRAFDWAEDLRHQLDRRSNGNLQGFVHGVSISCGVAVKNERTLEKEDLVEHADQALRAAKQTGRNRCVRRSLIEGSASAWLTQAAPFPPKDLLTESVMTSGVVSLPSTTTIETAAALLIQNRLVSAPVVDDDEQVVGIVSEKDLIQVLPTPANLTRPVSEIMNRNVVCYEAEAPAAAAFQFLYRAGVPGVCVVRDGKPVGMVTRSTLLRWSQSMLGRSAAAAGKLCGSSDHTDENYSLQSGDSATIAGKSHGSSHR